MDQINSVDGRVWGATLVPNQLPLNATQIKPWTISETSSRRPNFGIVVKGIVLVQRSQRTSDCSLTYFSGSIATMPSLVTPARLIAAITWTTRP